MNKHNVNNVDLTYSRNENLTLCKLDRCPPISNPKAAIALSLIIRQLIKQS